MAPGKAASGASWFDASEDEARARARDEGEVAATSLQVADRQADVARERTADQLVRLAAARVRETMDPRDPLHARWFDRRAAAAREALSLDERAAIAAEARAFALSLLARTGREGHAPRGVALVAGAPVERPAPRVAGRDAMHVAELARCALRFDLAVAAGVGRELWDEPATSWVELPPGLPAGQHVALTVRGDSMEPLLHAGDTILVKLGGAAAVGDVVVARRPEHGHIVKRVAAATPERLVLASLNASYDEVIVPQEPGAVVGTVVLRWCAHGRAQ